MGDYICARPGGACHARHGSADVRECMQACSGAVSSQNSLAAKLQKVALDCFMSDEQPPIRRVKMNGLHSAAAKLVAA